MSRGQAPYLPPPPRPLQAWGDAERLNAIQNCATKELERIIPDLTTSMGGVRRIMGTPMPFAYISHLRY